MMAALLQQQHDKSETQALVCPRRETNLPKVVEAGNIRILALILYVHERVCGGLEADCCARRCQPRA